MELTCVRCISAIGLFGLRTLKIASPIDIVFGAHITLRKFENEKRTENIFFKLIILAI